MIRSSSSNFLQSIPCRGEKYHEMNVGENIRYMISTQEEQLTQTLYDATRQEISTYANRRELMSAESAPTHDGGGFLSVWISNAAATNCSFRVSISLTKACWS